MNFQGNNYVLSDYYVRRLSKELLIREQRLRHFSQLRPLLAALCHPNAQLPQAQLDTQAMKLLKKLIIIIINYYYY